MVLPRKTKFACKKSFTFTYMSEKLIRILNTKTGEHIYRPAVVANDAKLLKRYGFIVQDFKEEKKVDLDSGLLKAMQIVEHAITSNETFDLEVKEQTLEELKAEYETLTGKKAGNKKAETIQAEILELKKQS
jgi:hypothetical protein